MTFWKSDGPVDQANEWAELSDDTRNEMISSFHAVGIKVLVSAFGDSEKPTTGGTDPTSTADNLAAWVKQYGLDGVDVDYEVTSLVD